DAMDPRRRTIRNLNPPGLQGVHQGGLHHVLDKIEVPPAEVPRQHGHQPPRFMAEEMLHKRSHRFRLAGDHGSLTLPTHFPATRHWTQPFYSTQPAVRSSSQQWHSAIPLPSAAADCHWL